MRTLKTLVFVAVITLAQSGCAPVEPDQTAAPPPPEPIIIRVSGYGAFADPSDRLMQRHRLMAMRASKLDAYRALVERVYGTSLSGSSTVQDMVLLDDGYRTMVDSVIRGARVVTVSEMPGGGYETVMELVLDGRFQQCLTNVNFFRYSEECRMPLPQHGSGMGDDVGYLGGSLGRTQTPMSSRSSMSSQSSAASQSSTASQTQAMPPASAESPEARSGKAKSNYLYNVGKSK